MYQVPDDQNAENLDGTAEIEFVEDLSERQVAKQDKGLMNEVVDRF